MYYINVTCSYDHHFYNMYLYLTWGSGIVFTNQQLLPSGIDHVSDVRVTSNITEVVGMTAM